jgi:transcriptional regulator with XRE-family HTH domain
MSEQDPSPRPSELASFGEELRREREIRGISLKEISDATKISKRFLDAIERNDHKTLPAPVFTRGFVREYARYLGLNHEEMVNRYNYAAAGDERIEKGPHLEHSNAPLPQHPLELKGPPPKKGIPPSYARIDRNIFFAVLIAALLGGVTWWAVKNKRLLDIDSARSETAAAAPIVPVRPPQTSTEPATPPGSAGMLRLSVAVIGDSWVTLEADGKTVLNTEMAIGEERSFEARENFRFRTIGNAAGVILTLNDVRLPPLGEQGEVMRNYVIDREDLAQPQTEGRTD